MIASTFFGKNAKIGFPDEAFSTEAAFNTLRTVFHQLFVLQ